MSFFFCILCLQFLCFYRKMNKRLLLTAAFLYGAWELFGRTAITGYNLTYGLAGVQFVGVSPEDVVFDFGLKITNDLPFDTFIYKVDLDVTFNGEPFARVQEHINRMIYGKSTIVVPLRVAFKKDFWTNGFLDFLKSGNYTNWLINLKGKITIDKLRDFPLNVDINIDTILRAYEGRREG